jgi:hypothetical protein
MTNEPGNDNHPQNRHPYWFFWLTAGLATIVAAIIGISVTHSSTGSSSNPGSSKSAPVSPSSPSATPASTPPPGPGPTAPTSTMVRWHGPITIGWFGIELDALPPTANTGTGSSTIRDQSGELTSGNNGGTYAQWTGSSAPTYDECHNWVLTNGNNSSPLPLTSGMQICVLTGSGRTAYLNITSLSSDGSAAHAQATVWNQ